MKRGGHYFCNGCRHEIDPRFMYAMTLSRVTRLDVYEVEREWHFCAACIRKTAVSFPTEDQGGV